MLGINYLKVPPTRHVIHFKNGRIVREGVGLSFFYFAPNSVIVTVPTSSVDVPFIFNEVTHDFQEASIQGELTYRITEPAKLAKVLDFSVTPSGRYVSDDPAKLNDRLVHAAQVLARGYTQRHKLSDLLVRSAELVTEVTAGLKQSETVAMLGVEVLGVSILAIQPNPEMAKALQAAAREALLRQADEAIYARRNAAVEMERTIRENELSTEIAVEQKRRQVRETQMAAEIAVETQRAELVDTKTTNDRKEADARAYALKATIEPIKDMDWRTLLAMSGEADGRNIVAMAFQQIAENADKVGELNISPDLLQSLLKPRKG